MHLQNKAKVIFLTTLRLITQLVCNMKPPKNYTKSVSDLNVNQISCFSIQHIPKIQEGDYDSFGQVHSDLSVSALVIQTQKMLLNILKI